ncbi:hypothetical protein AB0D66_10535 [Streptomyces sp. NPDC048270]|uniref:hypothetical protein n=1 Tax=Streptomyces sp. NPDC048270 TaxID=3154615 RepID=UPI0033D6DEBE
METATSLVISQFAEYLRGLTWRLDPGAGWYGEFLRRDPDGVRACLEGAAIPPWDVVESLLRDLAALRGEELAAREGVYAARLRESAVAAWDGLPGGAERLRAECAEAAAQQAAAREAVRGLTVRLGGADGPAEADALARELSWSQDDAARAAARHADLATRLSARGPDAQASAWPAAKAPAQSRAQASAGPHAEAPAESRAQASAWPPAEAPAQSRAQASAWPPAEAPAQSRAQASAGPHAEAPAESRAQASAWPPAEAPAQSRAQASAWPPAEASASARAHAPGTPRAEPSALVRAQASGTGPAEASGGYRAGASAGQLSEGSASGRVQSAAAADRPHAGASMSAPAGAWVEAPAEAPASDGGGGGGAAQRRGAVERAEGRWLRGRRGGGARYAGMAGAGAQGFVPPPGEPAAADGAGFGVPAPRGARFGWGTAEPEAPVPVAAPSAGDPFAQPPAEDARAVVGELTALRAQGRGGEAHALLCEIAGWPADRLPGLADRLSRAGLAADWATLLWEAASLPPVRLAAAAAALGAAGREADSDRLLRQGAARPTAEIADAALALGASGRTREADTLLGAFVRVRTAEEAAALARRDPGWFTPRLLQAAAETSAAHHRDLVHALRVAGLATA